MIGETLVGNAAATQITSSPLLMRRSPSRGDVSVINANKLADEPEFTTPTYFAPIYCPNSCSNCSQYRPDVNQNSKAESTKLICSSASYTREQYGILCPGRNGRYSACSVSLNSLTSAKISCLISSVDRIFEPPSFLLPLQCISTHHNAVCLWLQHIAAVNTQLIRPQFHILEHGSCCCYCHNFRLLQQRFITVQTTAAKLITPLKFPHGHMVISSDIPIPLFV